MMLGQTDGTVANPSNGMIDGIYARQIPSYYLHKGRQAGVRRVCVQIRSQGPAVLLGTVKMQDHSGTWRDSGRLSTLVPDSGTHEPPPTSPDDDLPSSDTDSWANDIASWMSTNSWWRHNRHPADHSTPHAVKPRGGRENCDFYAADDPNRPMNWCGMRRSITPAQGWTGHLTSNGQELRVQVRNHILNMPGRIGLQHNQRCP